MSESERMQQLHHRASAGKKLTADEETALQDWYDRLDREEALINRDHHLVDIEVMRENLAKTVVQNAAVSAENARLFGQNETLRCENEQLRRQVEARFAAEQAI